jgi:hypothetical protein
MVNSLRMENGEWLTVKGICVNISFNGCGYYCSGMAWVGIWKFCKRAGMARS